MTTEIAVALYKKKESNFGIFRVKSFLRCIQSTLYYIENEVNINITSKVHSKAIFHVTFKRKWKHLFKAIPNLSKNNTLCAADLQVITSFTEPLFHYLFTETESPKTLSTIPAKRCLILESPTNKIRNFSSLKSFLNSI